MDNKEQQLIENLFDRLKQAESQSISRDAEAEKLITLHLQQQPGASYYMAQSILIQEAAMKKLNERVNELEERLAQQPQQSSGGFLSGLFGNNQRQNPPASPTSWNTPSAAQQPYNAAPVSGQNTGFLAGALKTAVGVAGGVVMADMLTSMFHHSQPEEIVNIINDPPAADSIDTSPDTVNPEEQNAPPEEDFWSASDAGDDYSQDSFSDDDDSFI